MSKIMRFEFRDLTKSRHMKTNNNRINIAAPWHLLEIANSTSSGISGSIGSGIGSSMSSEIGGSIGSGIGSSVSSGF